MITSEEFSLLVLGLLVSFWLFTSKNGLLVGMGLGLATCVGWWVFFRAVALYTSASIPLPNPLQ